MDNIHGRTIYTGLNAERAAYTPSFPGVIFLETDTSTQYQWDGAAWVAIGGVGWVTGAGTNNYLAQFTGLNSVGDSNIVDNVTGDDLTITAVLTAPRSFTLPDASLEFVAAGDRIMTLAKAGTVPVGTGVVGRIAEWVTDANTLQASTLLKSGAGVLTLSAAGAYTGTFLNSGDVALGAGTLTVSTVKDVSGADHTHPITSSSNPGAAASILASNASGHLQLMGLGINCAPSATYAIDMIGANGLFRLGDTTADTTNKSGRMVVRHYNNSEEPVYIFGASSSNTANSLAIGGGNASANATMYLYFFTAANTITTTGTAALQIDKTQRVTIGNVVAGVDASAQLHIKTRSAVTVGLITQGYASQTADLTQWKNSVGDILSCVTASGSMGVGDTAPGTLLDCLLSNATTAAVNSVVTIGHNSTGTPDVGFGSRLLWQLKSGTGGSADQDAAAIDVLWTIALHGTRTSAMPFYLVSAGAALAEYMRLTPTGLGIGITAPEQKLHLVGDGVPSNIWDDVYHATSYPQIILRRAMGTVASPTQVLSGETLGMIGVRGWHSGGAFTTSTRAAMSMIASEDWTAAAQGTRITFATTTTGTTTTATRLTINNDGTLIIADAGNIEVGTTTGTMIGTAAAQKVALHGVAPCVQAAHIIDADGTLADITTKFNTLLVALENKGVLAAA